MMNPWRDFSRMPRAVWVVFAVTLVNRVGSMALAFLALYLTMVVHASAAHVGLVLASYGAGALAAGPLAARALRTGSPALVMAGSLLLSGAALLLLPLVSGIVAVAMLTAFWGLTAEAFRPASFTWLANEVSPTQRARAFALARLGVNLGMSVGSAIGGLLAERSFLAVFVVDGVTSLLAAGVLAVVIRHGNTRPVAAPTSEPDAALRRHAPVRLVFFLAGLTLAAMVFFQGSSTMPLYLVGSLGLAPTTYGLLGTLNAVAIITIELPLTSALVGWAHARSLAVGAILLGVGFGAFAIVRGAAGAFVAVCVWTLGEMFLAPTAAAHVATAAPPSQRAMYMGLYNTSWSAAWMLGPSLGTLSFAHFRAGTHWLLTGLVGMLAASLLAIGAAGTHELKSRSD